MTSLTRDTVLEALARLELPDGGNLVSRDFVRAVSVHDGAVRYVIEAPSAEVAQRLEGIRAASEDLVKALPGVVSVAAVVTAHETKGPPPNLKIGRHPTEDTGPKPIPGVRQIIAVGSGKGGVGKSTVSSNLAVALAEMGHRVGLLDADIYGPSQPRMMGATARPASPDGKTIIPLKAHGVTFMSIGLMVEADKAVVWRGPMLMGALQQMLMQVQWGELDTLIVDLPPGTGDVQLTLCQKVPLAGAVIVSTPQDVALLDARKALDMFATLKTPILGLVENMSQFVCPSCGHESHPFGHGGVKAEAETLGLPFLGSLPLDLSVRQASDAGAPAVLQGGAVAQAYTDLAKRIIS